MLRFLTVLLLVVLAGSLSPAPLPACPFCSQQGQTLTMEVNQASLVVFGSLSNPRLTGGDGDSGATDLQIEEVVKDHPFLKGKKTIVLPRFIPVDNSNKVRFLIFCDLFKERLDPYRGMPVKDKDIVAYLKGALAHKDKPAADRLAFFFPYLDHADAEIAMDSYKEFANADGKDVMLMVQKGDSAKLTAKLTKWLKDPETPSYRYGLYGYTLGLCGTEANAEVLLELLNDPQRGLISGIDGVLAGYVQLKPKEGWEYLRTILGDPRKEFTRRYAGLRAVRFFWTDRPELIDKKQLLAALTLLFPQSDIADLAIEDLRKWKQWQVLDQVLELDRRESHNVPIIRRAILRFALNCPPEYKKAQEFVEQQRKLDPEKVKDAEELLRLEQPTKS